MKNNLDYKSKVLDNGLEVVSIKKETELMCLINAIKVGSFYENEDEKGLAHFIEHMVFKGTEKRDNKKIIEDMELTGGENDAYTDNDSTVFSLTALKEEMEVCCDILSDMLINPSFKEEEIEKERKVILSEIKNSYDDIEDLSYRTIKEKAFPNNIMEYDVLGTREHVKNFKRDDLIAFYDKHYKACRCKVIVVSSYGHDKVFNMIEKYYGDWEKGEDNDGFKLDVDNKAGDFKGKTSENEQSTLMYLFTFQKASKRDELALRILDYKLGSSSNSILFKELREERGLCYSVHSNLTNFKDYNLLYIYASVAKEDIEECKTVIDKCIVEFTENKLKFDDSFFQVIKKVYKTEIASTLEGCNDMANFILAYALDDEDAMSFNKDIDMIDKLEKEDIFKVAKKLFKDPTISVIEGKEVVDENS